LDPAIPKQSISRIADVATGTGYEMFTSDGVAILTELPAFGWAMLQQNSQRQGIPLL
jgi:hypothetical protein